MNCKETKEKQQKRKEGIFRVKQISELLGQGYSGQEIVNYIQSPINISQKRGYLSVYNVQKSIKDLPFISEIKETKPYGYLDSYRKYDLVISLTGKYIDSVGVQVKSSSSRVSEFYKKLSHDPQEVSEILIQRRLIVLNGQLPSLQIQKSFLRQLGDINNFYQK